MPRKKSLEKRIGKYVDEQLKYIATIPAIIGIVAAIILISRVGLDSVINTVLSWIVGLTILSTFVLGLFKAFGYRRGV